MTQQPPSILVVDDEVDTCRNLSEVLQQGADAVCYKPFDVTKLLTTLEKLTQ